MARSEPASHHRHDPVSHAICPCRLVYRHSMRKSLRENLPGNFPGMDYVWCALAMAACGTHPIVFLPGGVFVAMITWETYLLCQRYKHDHAVLPSVPSALDIS